MIRVYENVVATWQIEEPGVLYSVVRRRGGLVGMRAQHNAISSLTQIVEDLSAVQGEVVGVHLEERARAPGTAE